MSQNKTYRVKILDLSYLAEFNHLNFRYLFYDVIAQHKEEAIKIARNLYLKGEKEIFSEELPFLLKVFTIDDKIQD